MEPNWTAITQSVDWVHVIKPWLTELRDYQREMAERAETPEGRFEYCIRARQLTEVLTFPEDMVVSERLAKAQENEDSGYRDTNERDRRANTRRTFSYRK